GEGVGAGRGGQGGAGGRPAGRGHAAELVAERGRGGHDDRGQDGAGGLGAGDGGGAVDHEQGGDLAGAGRPGGGGAGGGGPGGGGDQVAGSADGVDRVGLAVPALADVPGAVDLADLLPGRGQVPGQAQPVMPGALDGPGHAAAAGLGQRPAQQPGIPSGIGRD